MVRRKRGRGEEGREDKGERVGSGEKRRKREGCWGDNEPTLRLVHVGRKGEGREEKE